MDLDVESLQFGFFLDPTFLDFQISKFPDVQVPRFPDAAACGGAAGGRTLRSQPDPSPNAPRGQIRRKGPCCDLVSRPDDSLEYGNLEIQDSGNLEPNKSKSNTQNDIWLLAKKISYLLFFV